MMLGVVDEALSSTVVGGVAAVLVVVEVSVGEEDLVGAGETAAVTAEAEAEAEAEGAAGTGGVGTDFGVGSDGRTSDGRKDESRFLQRVEPLVGERFVVDWDLGKDTF